MKAIIAYALNLIALALAATAVTYFLMAIAVLAGGHELAFIGNLFAIPACGYIGWKWSDWFGYYSDGTVYADRFI